MPNRPAPDCENLTAMSLPELLYHALVSTQPDKATTQSRTNSWPLNLARDLDLFLHFGIGPFAAPSSS